MDEPVIELRGVAKSYSLESHPWRRLWGQLSGRVGSGPQYHALHGIDLQVGGGEVVGIVGRNGAGKSTLLQVVCGVLEPSLGERVVRGRVAALLELGAGFNLELTGRENVRLNGPLLGLAPAAVEQRMAEIADFAGIGEFIDQPVRSYSSGMFMRLAFAMATCMDPDILVVDEALSVGDGAFARKSFDRIMTMKDRGATILFCSHSTYHVESICSRAIWLDQGRVRMADEVSRVVAAYNDFIAGETAGVLRAPPQPPPPAAQALAGADEPQPDFMAEQEPFRPGHGRILRLHARTATQSGRELKLHTLREDLRLEMDFSIDPELPPPTMIIALYTRSGILVASAGSHNDGLVLRRDAHGYGRACLTLRKLPLLKGEYYINVILACERGLHYYENAMYAVKLELTQDGLEQGVVTLDREWS
jgi:lipopolysaccharide transport system ATP-binding protein